MNCRVFLSFGFSCVAAATLTGCNHSPPPVASAKPPVIPVSHPVQRKVTNFVDFTGRTAAVLSLDVRPRVSGYLIKTPFQEGAEVKKGDVLFEIDPSPYQAQYNASKAQVGVAEAALRLARVTYERNRIIASREPGAVSQQELDQYKAQEEQALANLNLAKANLDLAALRLSWCKVESPIDGQVSRYFLTLGNLVTQDQTLLTTVVSLDPIYAYFDVDERTVLRVRKGINEGTIKIPKDKTDLPVLLGLEGEDGYPHEGRISFINNQLTPSTGTILVRGVFDNPKPPNGRRVFSPGMFVRIRVPIGEPHPALLVIDRAVGTDQGLRFVYVVDKDNKVQYRRVTIGHLEDDGLRVIQSGDLHEDEWVAVGGLQQVRPRMPVDPDPIPMPTLAPPTAGGEAPPPTPDKPQPPPAGESKR
jgi:multidrug efflux system membrane fusion protein